MTKKKWVVKLQKDGVPRLNGKRGKKISGRWRGLRHVYKFGNVVLKLDTLESMNQCPNEYHKWNSIPKKDRKFFAKVLAFGTVHGKDYIIQRYIKDTKETTNRRLFYYKLRTVERLARIYNIDDLVEHEANWCINTGGNLKIIDLGL